MKENRDIITKMVEGEEPSTDRLCWLMEQEKRDLINLLMEAVELLRDYQSPVKVIIEIGFAISIAVLLCTIAAVVAIGLLRLVGLWGLII